MKPWFVKCVCVCVCVCVYVSTESTQGCSWGMLGGLSPLSQKPSLPLSPPPIKWHLYRSIESCHFECQSAPLRSPCLVHMTIVQSPCRYGSILFVFISACVVEKKTTKYLKFEPHLMTPRSGVNIRWASGQLSSEFGEGPQNVKTKGKC